MDEKHFSSFFPFSTTSNPGHYMENKPKTTKRGREDNLLWTALLTKE